MSTDTTEEYNTSLEDGVIQSLCYLYQELLRENMRELAYIMELAIQDCEDAIRAHFPISPEGEDALKQFHVLRGFRQLNEEQKEFFIREMERIQTKH